MAARNVAKSKKAKPEAKRPAAKKASPKKAKKAASKRVSPVKAAPKKKTDKRAGSSAKSARATSASSAGSGNGVRRINGSDQKLRPRRAHQIFAEPSDVHVLVVDDEPEVLNLLVPFLKKQGYTVSEAQDGDQALEKILTERPNIVVLDVMMPGLSGWEISRYVRERSELDPVRIIMATGIGKETNAATSPLYGADAYIDKPFRLDALHRTVKEVIARIESGNY
jgi:two-component system, OmpR family, response regulator RpaB